MSLNTLLAKYRQWREIKNTEAELRAMSDRELNDLGITRNDIQNVSRGKFEA